MKKFNVAVVGATGMVGESMISILEERAFPVEQLTPLASKRSLGQKVNFRSEDLEIIDIDNFDFNGIDFSFFFFYNQGCCLAHRLKISFRC